MPIIPRMCKRHWTFYCRREVLHRKNARMFLRMLSCYAPQSRFCILQFCELHLWHCLHSLLKNNFYQRLRVLKNYVILCVAASPQRRVTRASVIPVGTALVWSPVLSILISQQTFTFHRRFRIRYRRKNIFVKAISLGSKNMFFDFAINASVGANFKLAPVALHAQLLVLLAVSSPIKIHSSMILASIVG